MCAAGAKPVRGGETTPGPTVSISGPAPTPTTERAASPAPDPATPIGQREQPDSLSRASSEALACRRCEAVLPLGPRPVFRVSDTARVLIVSQAPGTKVHLSGLPFNDASGDRLRAWLGMDRDLFYDTSRIAIVPMGLCYPGRLPTGGDAPPRPECAPLWLDRFTRLMPQIRLTLVVGSYALRHRLGKGAMTDRVRRFREAGPAIVPLPHPSWRTTGWERRNPWFVAELLPALRHALTVALDDGATTPPVAPSDGAVDWALP